MTHPNIPGDVDYEDIEPQIEFRDPIKQLGFARIEHILTLDTKLSDGAFRTYAMLHYFWQRNQATWVGIPALAEARGIKERTAKEHLAELSKSGLVTRQRRFTRSSITYLEDLPERYKIAAVRVLKKRAEKGASFRRKSAPHSGEKAPDYEAEKRPREGELIEGELKKENTESQTDSASLQSPSNSNGHHPSKDPTAQQAMFEALVQVCLLPGALLRPSNVDGIRKMKAQVGKVASTLVGLSYSGQQVLACYSRDGWWWKEHWQGKDKKEAPTLGGILKTIGEATASLQPGHGSAWDDPQAVYRESAEEPSTAAAEFEEMVRRNNHSA